MMALAIILAAICGGIITANFMKSTCPFECDFCRKRVGYWGKND